MRLSLCSLIFAFALLFNGAAIAAPQVAPSERVQTRVIVRAAPNSESAPLDTLEPGETLELQSNTSLLVSGEASGRPYGLRQPRMDGAARRDSSKPLPDSLH